MCQLDEIAQRAVLDRDAFRHARRSGRIDDVRQLRRGDRNSRVGCRSPRAFRQTKRVRSVQPAAGASASSINYDAPSLRAESATRSGGRRRVTGTYAMPAFKTPEHCGNAVRPRRKRHGDGLSRATGCQQCVRDTVRAGVQLTVADRRSHRRNRGMIRRRGCVRLDLLVHQAHRRRSGDSRVVPFARAT